MAYMISNNVLDIHVDAQYDYYYSMPFILKFAGIKKDAKVRLTKKAQERDKMLPAESDLHESVQDIFADAEMVRFREGVRAIEAATFTSMDELSFYSKVRDLAVYELKDSAESLHYFNAKTLGWILYRMEIPLENLPERRVIDPEKFMLYIMDESDVAMAVIMELRQ